MTLAKMPIPGPMGLATDTQAPPTEKGCNSYGLATATSDRALLYRSQQWSELA
jgi:hypothetical protein